MEYLPHILRSKFNHSTWTKLKGFFMWWLPWADTYHIKKQPVCFAHTKMTFTYITEWSAHTTFSLYTDHKSHHRTRSPQDQPTDKNLYTKLLPFNIILLLEQCLKNSQVECHWHCNKTQTWPLALHEMISVFLPSAALWKVRERERVLSMLIGFSSSNPFIIIVLKLT